MLERAGLLAQEKDGRVRRCHLQAEPIKEAAAWAEAYRVFWDEQLGALKADLETPAPDGSGAIDAAKEQRNA